MSNQITFRTTGNRVLTLSQAEHDGPLTVSASGPDGQAWAAIIPAGDAVQLVNLYRYTKRYDLADSFINPHGRKIVSGGMLTVSDKAEPPAGEEEKPLPVWYFLLQDGDAGYHIYRRPVDEFNPDPARREDVNAVIFALTKRFVDARGGAFLAAWVESQLVEVADLADIDLDVPEGPVSF